MSSILKACVYNVKIDRNNLFVKPFKETLKDLASMLDDIGGNGNIRILDHAKARRLQFGLILLIMKKIFQKMRYCKIVFVFY